MIKLVIEVRGVKKTDGNNWFIASVIGPVRNTRRNHEYVSFIEVTNLLVTVL